MPYETAKDPPDSVRDNLPGHAQEIFRAAYNNAWDTYSDPDKRRGDEGHEEVAMRVAWSAVKNEYHKDDSGQWVHD